MDELLSTLSGVGANLVEPKPGCWVVVPIHRSNLRSRLWQALRAGPCGGVGHNPTEAALLFARAVGATGSRRIAPKHKAKEWLVDLLSRESTQGSMHVSDVRSAAARDQIPWNTVDRVARETGVIRHKSGFRAGWVWTRPP